MSKHNEWLSRAAPGVPDLQPYEPGKPLSELEREYGVTQAIKLASNESPLGPSPKALDAAQAVLRELALYPDGNGFELKHALSERLGVGPDWLTLGNGSNDVLELVARAFLAPGREAVFSQYAFAVYPIVTQAIGATARVAPARPADDPMPLGHDPDALAACVSDRTRVVFIANPNNPTGTHLDAAALRGLLARVPSRVIVVVDEAYVEYVSDPDYPDTLAWLAEFPNLIITRTFSKAYGLAGLRVGYAIARPEITDLLNRVRQPFNVNSVALAAATAALADREHVARAVTLNNTERETLARALAELGLKVLPSVGNFLCVDLARPAGPVYEALLHHGVIVRPLAGYGLPQHIRVTVGLPEENRRFLQALTAVLQDG